MQHRAISTIAQEITTDWHSRIYFGAVPYLKAMQLAHQHQRQLWRRQRSQRHRILSFQRADLARRDSEKG